MISNAEYYLGLIGALIWTVVTVSFFGFEPVSTFVCFCVGYFGTLYGIAWIKNRERNKD